jgi:uncharacterized ion transporter superfamily protein YfcC
MVKHLILSLVGFIAGVLKFQEKEENKEAKKVKTENKKNGTVKQKYLVLVVFCGNFCVLLYDTVIYQHYTAPFRNECNVSVNFFILVHPVVLCFLGHK